VARASRTSRSRSSNLNSTAISTIMTGPPVNSARAWIIADSQNPRISAQVISHVIDAVIDSACRTARIEVTSHNVPGLEPA